MDLQATKCVMIIDNSLPPGVVANLAAIKELVCYGLALEGPKKKINKLTGSLLLLR